MESLHKLKKKQQKSQEPNKDTNSLKTLNESGLSLQTAENIFRLYLLMSTIRMAVIAYSVGYFFQVLDCLLVHSSLFISYLWYQFENLKYNCISVLVTLNFVYLVKSLHDSDDKFSWGNIFYSLIVLNCGMLAMTNSLYLASKRQLYTANDDLFNRVQLHLERKEHTCIMNSLMPAPVTEQVLLKGEVPIYRKEVTIGFIYFTFYDKTTTHKIKDISSCVDILHYIVINLDRGKKFDAFKPAGSFFFKSRPFFENLACLLCIVLCHSPLKKKEIEQWEFDVIKIEHVGSAYLVCGGVTSRNNSFNHAEAS
ncbi:hypothetical protein RFI_15972 [Reticulomyxa filosa]|uniref:Uncharacterized protein n=1 Tax=Reticulomyxa filosa TaxID=46433 RepID=X6N5M3_RETFI|nr:hypothetical protein RFI_15972 [Reticulomyxa filosa]|eukprot:ETO21233.1 hypothetical protein RFI_15972 [Reticulomyxa filosa]